MSFVKKKIIEKLKSVSLEMKSISVDLDEHNIIAFNSIIQSILSIEQEIENIKTGYTNTEDYKQISEYSNKYKQLFLTGWFLNNL